MSGQPAYELPRTKNCPHRIWREHDILLLIFEHLISHPPSVRAARRVCRTWNSTISESSSVYAASRHHTGARWLKIELVRAVDGKADDGRSHRIARLLGRDFSRPRNRSGQFDVETVHSVRLDEVDDFALDWGITPNDPSIVGAYVVLVAAEDFTTGKRGNIDEAAVERCVRRVQAHARQIKRGGLDSGAVCVGVVGDGPGTEIARVLDVPYHEIRDREDDSTQQTVHEAWREMMRTYRDVRIRKGARKTTTGAKARSQFAVKGVFAIKALLYPAAFLVWKLCDVTVVAFMHRIFDDPSPRLTARKFTHEWFAEEPEW